ncbi:MAG: hypothetical protein PHY12_03085 [Eubacteriales bacterium]|nr:hypothetical protein [Eubacteriales bacterium]
MNVLIVSYCFAPQNAIGAVRATKLAKYLTRMGYSVTVIGGKGLDAMQDPILARDLEALSDVHIVRERSLLRRWKERGQAEKTEKSDAFVATAPTPARTGWKHRVMDALYLFLADRADGAWARAALREARALPQTYDYVISSYGPPGVHTAALAIKREGVARRWIADFRDEAAFPFAWQKGRLGRYIRSVREHADAVTAVSEGYLRVMGLEKLGTPIPNGFDREDLPDSGERKAGNKLTFIHCGQMYGGHRDLTPLFKTLRALMDEGCVDEKRVSLVYAGRDTSGFVDQARACGLENCLTGYGFMPRDESIRLQQRADVLLLAAWNYQNRLGNLPGKLLEYMLLRRPVLCCVAGDVPQSEAGRVIERTNIGFCYEQARQSEDAPRLRAYVLELWAAFERGEASPYAPDEAAVEEYTSAKMAERFAALMKEGERA